MSRVSTRILVAMLAASLLAGCAAALVGSASRSGVYKDSRSPAQIDADARLASAVRSKLIADPGVKASGVTVTVNTGVVTLKGTVQKPEQSTAAARAAQSVKGVKGVRNELRVSAK
jgi:osmotically-inducible protein OsmY